MNSVCNLFPLPVEGKASRTSQTPRAVLIDQHPDDKQHLQSIPTARRGKAFPDRGIHRPDGSLRSALFFAGKHPGHERL
jgi:hypothetical protein